MIPENNTSCWKRIGSRNEQAISIAEFLGTAILVFVSCLGASLTSSFLPSFVSGLAVLTVIHLFGHISGAHVNPVTTICAYIMGQIDAIMIPFYFVPQMLGAITGFGLLMHIFPSIYHPYGNGTGMTLPSEHISSQQIFYIEFIITGILSLANCASWDKRVLNDSVALRFGFIVAVLNFIAAPYTGCSMNPARSFAPALLLNRFTHHWIYWLAQILAACIFSTIYRFILLKKE